MWSLPTALPRPFTLWWRLVFLCVFFFNDTATTEIYTLSLHDALPISLVIHRSLHVQRGRGMEIVEVNVVLAAPDDLDRLAHLLREQRGFRNVIRLGLAPESAAQQRHMAQHVFFLDAHRERHGLLHGLRILRARPRDYLAVFE